jgi:hypothetical protein
LSGLALLGCSLLGKFLGPLSLAALGPGAAAVEWISGLAGVDWLGDKGTRMRPLLLGAGFGIGAAAMATGLRAALGAHLELHAFELSPLLIGVLTSCLMAFQRELLEHAFLAQASRGHPALLRTLLGILMSGLSAWGLREPSIGIAAAALVGASTTLLWTQDKGLMAVTLRLGYAASAGTLFAGAPIALSGGSEASQWVTLLPLAAIAAYFVRTSSR